MKKLIIIAVLTAALLFVACDSDTPAATTPNADPGVDNTPHTHAFGEWQTVKEATCTGEGREERVCECGESESRKLDLLEHEYTENVIEPTCVEGGYTEYVCACGRSYKDNKTQKTGHEFGEWTVLTAPTCQTKGTEEAKCKNCDHTATQETERGAHTYGEWAVSVAATCTTAGEKRRECQNAGCDAFESKAIYGGHEYGDWYEYRAATCTANGEERRSCTKCDHYESKSIGVTPHSFGAWYASSSTEERRVCTKCYAEEVRSKFSGSMTATGVAEIQIVNTPYQAGSKVHPYRRQGGCYNGVNAYQALITKNNEYGKIAKKNVITGETIFSEYVKIGHGDDVFYLPATNCIYVGSGSSHYVFDADTLEYKGVQELGDSSGCLYYIASTNTYINSSGTVYDANFKKISSISKQAGENIGKTVQGHCADENYIYELRCQGIGGEKYYTYIQIHTTDGKYVGTVTVKIPENFEPENISVVDGELYIAACSTQPVVTFYKVVFD